MYISGTCSLNIYLSKMSCLTFREIMKYGTCIRKFPYCSVHNKIHNQTYKTKSLPIVVTEKVIHFLD